MSKLAMWIKRLARAGVPALCVGLAVALSAVSVPVAIGETGVKAGEAGERTQDQIILRSGRVVDGRILEETDTAVVFMVNVSGIEARTTYNKSEILEIKRGVAVAAAEAPSPAGSRAASSSGGLVPAPRQPTASSAEDEEGMARLFVVELEGRFGFDISTSPLRRVFEEADKEFNDLIPGSGSMAGKMVVDPSKRDLNIVVLKMNSISQPGAGSIFVAEDIAPVIQEQILDKNRRVVFWVKLAGGGAAFLPWISPEIYFTPDGILGGLGDLDEFTAGDKMVTEKLISAYLGAAEGFAIRGGYGDHIPVMRAMFRKQYWLYVKFEGGRPIYLDRELRPEDGDGWTLLSDDGKGPNKDTGHLRGNDLFALEHDWAEKLGISDGVAETVDDLAFRLGVHRHYRAIEGGRGQRAVDEWKQRLDDAVRMVIPQDIPQAGIRRGRLWRDLDDIRVGGDYNERRRQRGRQIQILRQIRSIVQQFKEVLDRDGSFTANIDVQISALQLEAERDARAQRTGGR